MLYPDKPRRGDRVAVLSPSSGLPGLLPLPYELGLRRLRELFELEPVEYPTTRRMNASAADRASDLRAAFADDGIAAVIASIGGDDQITLLPHLDRADRALLAANPKPFFGFSDNTVLLTVLRNLGMVGYHGASVMTEFGRPGAMHPATLDSVRHALLGHGPYRLPAITTSRTIDVPWDDPASFERQPELEPCTESRWVRGADQVVTGELWGGSLEVLSWLLMADREIGSPRRHAGAIAMFETSGEMPPAGEVFRILRGMGERGLLSMFAAVLVGRPKTWALGNRTTPEQRRRYAEQQAEAMLRALDQYAPGVAVVLDLDVGHTDPQLVLPIGAEVRVDGPAGEITVTY